MSRTFISLGSNIDPAGNIAAAVDLMRARIEVVAISTVYRTPPIGRPEQEDYYNAVVEARTELEPRPLRDELRRIEDALGRARSADKYAARTIDLDILLYDDRVIRDGDLTIPSPDIAARPFLAAGLAELDPDLVLADTDQSIGRLAESPGTSHMTPLADYTAIVRGSLSCSVHQD
jgi:2-amino-4-hydroxy-6-hydroxymethyldihydropteridine diphosphokinase